MGQWVIEKERWGKAFQAKRTARAKALRLAWLLQIGRDSRVWGQGLNGRWTQLHACPDWQMELGLGFEPHLPPRPWTTPSAWNSLQNMQSRGCPEKPQINSSKKERRQSPSSRSWWLSVQHNCSDSVSTSKISEAPGLGSSSMKSPTRGSWVSHMCSKITSSVLLAHHMSFCFAFSQFVSVAENLSLTTGHSGLVAQGSWPRVSCLSQGCTRLSWRLLTLFQTLSWDPCRRGLPSGGYREWSLESGKEKPLHWINFTFNFELYNELAV